MKENIILGIKGFFIGIANIIPGVSGGTLAITLGIYEELIDVISHFFLKLKDNIKFLIPIVIGALLSIALGSKVITYSLDKFPLPTILFFTGLILGGIPMLTRKVKGKVSLKNIIIFFITFLAIIALMFLKSGSEVSFLDMSITSYLMLFIVGLVAAATMIIPGISGSFMLMVMGYYEPILHTINDLTSFNDVTSNLLILIPFGLGILVGIILIAKLIEYLFQKFEVSTYFGILGFVLASIIGIFTSTKLTFSILPFIVGIVLFIIGFLIAHKLGDE